MTWFTSRCRALEYLRNMFGKIIKVESEYSHLFFMLFFEIFNVLMQISKFGHIWESNRAKRSSYSDSVSRNVRYELILCRNYLKFMLLP